MERNRRLLVRSAVLNRRMMVSLASRSITSPVRLCQMSANSDNMAFPCSESMSFFRSLALIFKPMILLRHVVMSPVNHRA